MRWAFSGPAGEVVVEQARVQDAAAVLRIHRAVIDEGEWFITEAAEFSASIDQKVRFIRDLERDATSVFLVARLGGVVVGFLTIRSGVLRRMRHAGKLEIMVGPEARGAGVGHALMTAAIEWSTANPHLSKLGLSVFTTNTRAIGLYRKYGFEDEGLRRNEYRLDDGTFRDDLLMYRFC